MDSCGMLAGDSQHSLLYFIQVLKDDSYITKKQYINHELVEIKSLS